MARAVIREALTFTCVVFGVLALWGLVAWNQGVIACLFC